jgi:hypothetical protein
MHPMPRHGISMLHICTHVQPSYTLYNNPATVLESAVQGLRMAFEYKEVPSYDELIAIDQLCRSNDILISIDPANTAVMEVFGMWIASIDNNDPVT